MQEYTRTYNSMYKQIRKMKQKETKNKKVIQNLNIIKM